MADDQPTENIIDALIRLLDALTTFLTSFDEDWAKVAAVSAFFLFVLLLVLVPTGLSWLKEERAADRKQELAKLTLEGKISEEAERRHGADLFGRASDEQ